MPTARVCVCACARACARARARACVCINCPAETLCSCQYVVTQLISPMLEYDYLIVELELAVDTIDILHSYFKISMAETSAF